MITFVFAVRFTMNITKFRGYLSLGFMHIRFAMERLKPINQIEADEARKLARRAQYRLDAHKRKSLQPVNNIPIPKGWDAAAAKPKSQSTKARVGNLPVTPPLENTFTHDFFGSQLVIGDIRIGQGLTKTKHRLEIRRDQLTIDNVPQQVNQGELERIKQLIRASRE